VLLTIKGRVDSASSPQLEQALEAAHDRGIYKIVLDLSELEYMSSSGFRALIAAQRASKSHHHGEVVLAGLPEQIRPALDMAGFAELFEIFDRLQAAQDYINSRD
jgi:anti-sigma B factor antagonist